MAKIRLIWLPLYLLFAVSPAFAQAELSLYGGASSAMTGNVSGNEPGGLGRFSFPVDWQGANSALIPAFGVRLTLWESDQFGWGLDFNHSKIYADDASLRANGVNQLDFGDGLNLLTVNAYRRWQVSDMAVSPYVGAGLGLAIPNVSFNSGAGLTSDTQPGGPAVQWVAGASLPIGGNLSLFGEYKGTISMNAADLIAGGNLDANVKTNAINVGISLGF